MSSPPQYDLSIVIPAFNEASRLPATLLSVSEWAKSSPLSVEVVVVDDGSDDETLAIAQQFQPGGIGYRVIAEPHRGKASAVRVGMLAGSGNTVLFTDADLSTPIDFADALLKAILNGADIAIGSREGTGSRRVGEPIYRHFMGRGFNALVRLLAVPGIRDTQCGFKAFRREVAHDLFRRVRLYTDERRVDGPRVTGFDVEVLFLARRFGYRVVETPVFWKHAPGSKVRPLHDSFTMLLDVVRVRYFALRGRYD